METITLYTDVTPDGFKGFYTAGKSRREAGKWHGREFLRITPVGYDVKTKTLTRLKNVSSPSMPLEIFQKRFIGQEVEIHQRVYE